MHGSLGMKYRYGTMTKGQSLPFITNEASAALRNAILYILNKGLGEATDNSFGVVEWGIKQCIVTPEQA